MRVIIPGRHDLEWRDNVVCGKQDGCGCGATLEISRGDLFTDAVVIDDGIKAEMVLCLCLCCGHRQRVGWPKDFGKLPTRAEWEQSHPQAVEEARKASDKREAALDLVRSFTM